MAQELVTKIRLDDKQFKSIVDKVKNEVSSTEQTFKNSSGNIKAELKAIQNELSNMLLNGVDPASAKFQQLSSRAGEIQDAMGDARSVINDFGNDTRGLTNVLDVAGTGVAAFQMYAGSMAMLGVESKEAKEVLAQLAGAMSVLNGMQQIQAQLLDQSTGTYKAYHTILRTLGLEQVKNTTDTTVNTAAQATNNATKEQASIISAANTAATQANTTAKTAETVALNANTTAINATTNANQGLSVAQKLAAGASKVLKVALASMGIGLLIMAVTTLITHWEDIVSWFKKTFPITEKLGAAFEKVKQTIAGVNGVIVYIASNIGNIAKAIGKLYLSLVSGVGLFTGATKEAFKELQDFGKGAKNAFSIGFDEKGNQIAQKKLEDALNKQKEKLKEDFEDRKAKYGDDTKESIKHYNKLLSLTKKGTKEYKEIQRDLWAAERKLREENQKDRLKKEQETKDKLKKINEQIVKDRKEVDKFLSDTSIENKKNTTKSGEDNLKNNYNSSKEGEIKTQNDLDRQLKNITYYYQETEKYRREDLVAEKEAINKKYEEHRKKAHGNAELIKRIEEEKNKALMNADVNYFNALDELRRQKYKDEQEATNKLLNPQKDKLKDSVNGLNTTLGIKFNTQGIEQGGEALRSYIEALQDKLKIKLDLGIDLDNLNSAGLDKLSTTFNNLKESFETANKAREILQDGLSQLIGGTFGQFLKEAESLKKVLSSDIATESDKIGASMSAMGNALATLGKDSTAAKAGLVLAAIGQIILGFAQATAKDAKLGVIGWIAAITAGMAVMISTISQLSSFSQGGIFKGNSRVGDQNIARVNAGEMILTRTQQSNLMRLLDNNNAGLGGGTGINEVRIKGSDLYLALSNYSKIKSKTGKSTGIK